MCTRANIPTAGYARHTDKAAALADLPRFGLPVVIKADGLAADGGVGGIVGCLGSHAKPCAVREQLVCCPGCCGDLGILDIGGGPVSVERDARRKGDI